MNEQDANLGRRSWTSPDQAPLTYSIKQVGGTHRSEEGAKDTSHWDIEFVFNDEGYWRRKEPLVRDGFDPPEKEHIEREFFTKRQLYEMVGKVGVGRTDTGELDLHNAPRKTF